MNEELLNKVYDLLVTERIAHEHDRRYFLNVFPREREFKFMPIRMLGWGGKIIMTSGDTSFIIRVTTENVDRVTKRLIAKVNHQIAELETSA